MPHVGNSPIKIKMIVRFDVPNRDWSVSFGWRTEFTLVPRVERVVKNAPTSRVKNCKEHS